MSGINTVHRKAGIPVYPAHPRRKVVISVYSGEQLEYALEVKDLASVETVINNHPERDFTVSWDDLERWLIRSGVVTIRWER